MFVVAIFPFALSLLNFGGSSSSIGGDLGQNECGSPLSRIPFDDPFAAAQYYCKCNFPTHILTAECILTSCPPLGGLCPLNPDQIINQTAINTTMSILNTCIGQNNLICGMDMNRVPLAAYSWTMAKLVPTNMAQGTCVINLNDGYLDVFSGAKFTVSQINGHNITLVIQAAMTSEAIYNCTFHVCPRSVLNLLLRLLTSANSLNTPRVLGTYSLNASARRSIDLSTPTPLMDTLDDQSEISGVYSNFESCGGEALNKDIVDTINHGVGIVLRNSVAIAVAINFLSTLAALGLKAAQIGCQ